MHSFDLNLVTKLYFGVDRHLESGKILQSFGAKNVLILYGQKSAVESGLLESVTERLDEEKIDYVLYGGISANPEIIHVRKAKVIGKEYNIDYILAVGGGSVIDVAKAVAVAFNYDGDELDFNKRLKVPESALPLGVILTHSSAGSEMSPSCVISEAASHFKQGFRSDLVRPKFAILNPELTYSVSPYQTAVGIVDSFMHSLERYFNESDDISLSDRFAEAIFITLKEAAEVLISDPYDEVARANVMLASTFSHNDITGLGKKVTMPAHALEHALSALYPSIAHGHGLAVIYPAWLRFNFEELKFKLDRLARVVFNSNLPEVASNAQVAIRDLSDLFMKMGLSLSLRSLGVKESDLEVLANIVSENGQKNVYHTIKPLTKNDIIAIYEDCY